MKTFSGKWLIGFLLFFSFTFGIGFSAAAQCTFGKGDLVFTGYNLLDDGTDGNTVDDSFSFLLLNKISAGQVIYFTDLGWTAAGAFQTSANAHSDAILKWTADVAYPAGTEIIINCKYKLTAVAIDGSARGTVAIEQDSYNSTVTNPKEHMSLGEIAGDQIFAFTGSPAAPVFLAGISVHRDPALAGWDASLPANEFASQKSMLPADLVSGAQNLVIQKLLDGESAALAARYDKATKPFSGLPATLRTAINTFANWEIKSDGNPFAAPILTAQVYAVTGVTIGTQPVDRLSICPGAGTTFAVVASNVCTYQWKVSTDGGTIYNNVANAGVYSGATTATLTISNVAGLNNNKYLVELSGIGITAVSSNPATLTLVNPTIVFTSTLPDAVLNVPYSQTLAVSAGGTGTFTYSVSAGSLPTGLTLSPAGVLSGTATVGGTSNFDIKVSDNCTTPNTKTNSYTFTVAMGNQTVDAAFTDLTKPYSTTTFTLPPNTSAGLPITYVSETTSVATISGNTVTLVGAGTTKITASQPGNTNYNPATPVDKVLTVTARPITVTATAATKVYGQADPTLNYTITSGSLINGNTLSGALSSPTASGAGVGSYPIVQNTLTGGASYSITYVPANLSITAKTLTLTLNATPLITKVYNNTTTASLVAANYNLSGIEFSDAITVSGAATYDTKDVGTGKTITANTFVLAGAKKDNYNLTTATATTTGDVTALPITLALNATPVITKVYNNSTTATLVAANYALTGVLGLDAVSVSGAATYDTKDAGTGKTITANTFVLAGAQKGNYNLTTTTATTTGDITALPITLALNATPAINKVYDNSTTAALVAANYALAGVLGLDAVSVSGTATYDTKDAGTGKTITANTFVLAGAQKGNYNLTTTTATTTGDITALPITLALNATPVITKVYNNNTGATLAAANYSLIGVLGLDAVTVSGTATYDTKDAGTGKTITANTFVLAGAQKGNYNLTTTTATTTGDITTLPVTLALNATPVITKVYDNSTSATLVPANYALTGVLGLDAVTVSGTATYDTKDAGTGKTITANNFALAGAQQGNYSLTTTTATTTGNITALPVTLALNATPMVTKVYDNSTTATLVPANYSLTGVLGLDAVTVSGTATYDTKNVGTGKMITANTFVLAGAQKGNYNLTTTTATTTGDITALPVTLALNATPVVTKVYDNSTTATLVPANYTLTGVLGLDAVTVSGTATYDTKDAGTGKTITANNFALAGAQQGNYSLTTTTATTTGNITALPVTLALNATPVITKVYDNSTTATLVPANYSLTGVLGLDAVTVSGTATYDTKNVGTGKTITANTFVLAGAQKGNYNLTTTTATTTGNITALPITLALNATPVITKVYDNSTTATLAAANYTLTGVLGLDAVTVSGTATYDTKDAGTGKTITANTFVLAGAQNGNYNLTTTTATTTGDITALPVTLALNATPVITKVYDNGTGATLIPSNYTLTGVLGLDAVTVSGTATYDTKNVGTGKTITANAFVLAGAQKGNYNLTTTTATTTGNITALPVTLALNATPVITKVYDNSTTATLAAANYTLTGVLGLDAVTVSGTAAYDTKDAGTGKTITANSFTLAGAQQGNYSLTTTAATTTGNITVLPVTLTLNATPLITKVYDNSTNATLAVANYNLAGILGSDAVTVSGTAAYDTKDAGIGKTITANTLVLAGAQKGNYNLTTTTATTTGNITNKTLTVALNATPAVTKVYDNSTTATLIPANYTLTGVETGDVVTVSGTAVYDTKDAGTAKVITANAFVLAGAQKDNYTVNTTMATTTGDITTKTLSLALNATPLITKAYDNTTAALLVAGNYSLSGILGTDAVTVSGVAAYDTKDAGTGKTIMANTFILAGAQKGNYNLTTATATTTGNITALPVTLALNATPLITKVYDNSTTAALVPANYTLTGVLGSDAVTVSGTAVYDTKNAGTGKTITVNNFALAGAQQGNYSLTTTTASTMGNVTTKAITLALNATPVITKVYNNNTTATLAPANYSLSGILGTDVVTVSGMATYNTKDAGIGKTITVNTFILAGAQQGNYALITTTAATTGNITASALTLALNSTPLVSKIYDGNAVATLLPANYTLTGVQGTDIVTVTGNANYSSKDFGVGKTITANGFVLAGAQKDNYSLTTTTATVTGNINTKTLTVTADDKTKYQGTANPPLTVSYADFVSGEGTSNLTTLPTASTTATVASAVGNYDITASGGAALNYSFSFVKGTLKVLPGAPTNITLAAVPLYENRPAGTVAGTLSSTSDNPSSTFTYTLVSGTGGADNASFSIVGDQLRSTTSFDFETKSTYSLLVRSTTQYGLSLDKVITINVLDVNEVPTLATIADQIICYTRSTQNVALTGISAGPETSQTTTLSVSSNNANLFDRLTVSGTGSTATLVYQAKTGAAGTATVTVTVKDSGGTANGGVDTYSRTFVITVNALPVLSINSDKGLEISKGETVFLNATGAATYAWATDNSIVNGAGTATLQVRPRQTTTYTVTGTNASGCTETQSITITVLDDLAKINATNILTPNGDGYNDKWMIDNIDFYPNNEVKVFDKAGRLVYAKKGYDNSWEGTYNGTALSEGTYYYVIDFGTGRRVFKGFITIVRSN